MFERPPTNAEMPDRIPLRPMGRVPVLARVEFPDGAWWVPVRAIRWTSTHVMVVWTDEEDDLHRERPVWLLARDVRRRVEARQRGCDERDVAKE